MENKYIVYAHVFPNGKQYVGITCQKVNRRWRRGKGYSQNIRMINAINKYGWENIQHVVLYDDLTIYEAEKIERELISRFDLTNEAKGYNYAEGGIHPRHSERTKKKIGEKSKGRHHTDEFKKWISQKNSGSGNFMYGKHHTTATKQKISESKKGGHGPNKGKFGSANPCSKAVIACDPITGKELFRFGAIIEAAHYIHKSPSGIHAVLSGLQQTSGGFVWRRADG